MVTYELIAKANSQIKTLPIHGKEYAEVNERIKAFRMVYPQGSILTDMIFRENGLVIFKARVLDRDIVLGEGTAYEKENSNNINKTSYIENCETSAVGRALGMAGFGIDTAVASAEEILNATEQTSEETPEQKPAEVKPLPSPYSDEERAERTCIFDELRKFDPDYITKMIEAKHAMSADDIPTNFWKRCLEKKRKEVQEG